MSPQRRTALVSVGAACLLVAIKLVVGLASSSLGLLAEAAHSGTDLAAALLTFFAVSVAVRPADRGHPYGHAKAQNLAALAEAGFLISRQRRDRVAAILRLAGVVEFEVDPTWWTFAAIGLVLAIDASRTLVSLRGARLYRSDALLANALHFGSDFAGTLAVLAGLIAAAAGFQAGDSIAALFVSGPRRGRRFPARWPERRRAHGPLVRGRRQDRASRARVARPPGRAPPASAAAGGREHFADVVIGVAPGAAIGQGHAAADRVEDALQGAFPGIDVVVHVEPRESAGVLRERILAAALTVSYVREIHNLKVLDVDGSIEVALHLKLPGDFPLDQAHDIAEQVEAAIHAEVPEVKSVQTHLEPLRETALRRGDRHRHRRRSSQAVREETGAEPRELRFVRTDDGIVVFLTLGLGGAGSLAEAHGRASAIEERVRSVVPAIADVVVHTEP